MEVLFGFAVLVAMGYCVKKGAEAAAASIRKQWQTSGGKFRAQHPTSNRAAAMGASAWATLRHGTKPALEAFKADWCKHFDLKKQAIDAKYHPVPPVEPVGMNLFDESIDDATPDWEPPTEPAPTRKPLRVVRDGEKTTGGTMPNLPTTEVRRIADIRNLMGAYRQHMGVEADDAAAAVQRAKDNERWLAQLAEQAQGVLDNDPDTVARITSLLEPARARVQAAEMHAAAADQALAASDASLAGMSKHQNMEEAVGATPQASSNTAVYAGN